MFKKCPEILLDSPIPPPMFGVSPRTIMGQARWDIERKKVYAATDYHCAACGRKHKSFLEAHERYVIDWQHYKLIFKEIVALCYYCHNFIHSGRLSYLVREKEMTRREFDLIIDRGFKILKKAGLDTSKYDKNTPNIRLTWNKWRMVYGGIEYKPKVKNLDAYGRYYAP